MRKFFNLAALALILCGVAAFGWYQGQPEPSKALSPAVFKVILEKGHGSAIHIGDGYVLSAAHVVSELKSVELRSEDGRVVQAETLWANKTYDIALLRLTDASNRASSPLACRAPKVGETVTLLGNPINMEFVSVWGHVAGTPRPFKPNWERVGVVNAAVIPGQSGGPVLDKYGNVVGITVGVMVVPLGFSGSIVGIGYFVPGDTLCLLMARKG